MDDPARRFAARHPLCWHVIEAEGVARAARDGLLPAAEIMRRAGAVSHANRARFVALDGAILRVQQMSDERLRRVLGGRFREPAEWRAHVDAHVFFWLTPARRDGFLRAATRERRKAEPAAPDPVVLEFDTATLLAGAGEAVFFSRSNSSSMVMGAGRVRRDETLYRPVGAWGGGPAAELAIRGAVPPVLLRAALRGGSLPA